MAFRVASTGTKKVVSKVTTSQNTKVKKVTLGKPIHSMGVSGAGNQKLVELLDVTPSDVLRDGSVVRYNEDLDTWETVLLTDNPRTLDGGFY